MVRALYGWQYEARQWLVGCGYALFPPRAKSANVASPVDLAAPRRVLLVIAGLLGDTVMSTPVIAAAREIWPGAELVLLGGRRSCELLAACPLLDDRVEAPAIPFALWQREALGRLKGWLREARFDVALVVLGDQFASVLAEAGIPVRVGVRGHALAPCLTHTYAIGGPRTWGPSERLNALRVLGFDVPDLPPRLWVADAARTSARRRMSSLGLPVGTSYVAIHPFGSTPWQWWPGACLGSLTSSLRQRYGWVPVLLGGPETRSCAVEMTEGIVDARGELTLPELLAVIEGAEIVISTDSGPFHIAGALERPLVGLFRGRRPEHASRYPRATVLLGQDTACARACEWNRCRRRLPCGELQSLTVPEVLAAVERVLGDCELRIANCELVAERLTSSNGHRSGRDGCRGEANSQFAIRNSQSGAQRP